MFSEIELCPCLHNPRWTSHEVSCAAANHNCITCNYCMADINYWGRVDEMLEATRPPQPTEPEEQPLPTVLQEQQPQLTEPEEQQPQLAEPEEQPQPTEPEEQQQPQLAEHEEQPQPTVLQEQTQLTEPEGQPQEEGSQTPSAQEEGGESAKKD